MVVSPRLHATIDRLLGSLFGMSGPKFERKKPRREMSLEAANRRDLLRALITSGGVATGEVCSCYLSCLLVSARYRVHLGGVVELLA